MGTPENPPTEPTQEVGFSTRTDVAGTTQTQGDSNPTDHALESDTGDAATEPQPEPLAVEAVATSEAKPGEALGDNAPQIDALQNQKCPNCTTGVLYVTRYDPHSLYESDQGAALAKGHESGGAYDVECRHCGFTDSRAFNPGNLWGR
jgi:hypothetical protein